MLRVAEQWHQSDLGRQRHGNEDSFYARSPLFAVADGMGGAQAGEVASAMAVESFEAELPGDAPTEALVTTIKEANRRIHERSRSDQHRAGMGTTLTVAYVGEGEVVVAHVGDSRCYLLRDGDLIRLTRDHSLVEELLQRGKLTQAQAEAHPQRSVITRALGPEPNVEVDVDVFPAKPGDVYLLCSDGLTSMVPESQLKSILTGASSLEEAGRSLIASANEAGGRDNITVVLFRLEAVEQAPGAAPRDAEETRQFEAIGGAAAQTREQGASDERGGATTVAVVPESPDRAAEPEPAPVPRRTTPLSEAAAPRPAPPKPPRRRRRRRLLKALIIALVIALPVLTGAWLASRAVYFVGTDSEERMVTIFRGVPFELPLGIKLYEVQYRSGVPLAAVPASRRDAFTDHELRSIDDAEELVRELERGDLNP